MDFLISLIATIIAFVIAITIHEVAHAWTADRLGDPTARLMGRLSLNPLVHYDQVGTTLLLVTSIMKAIGLPVIPFGWAKPVQFDPYNLKNPRRDSALISLAGPASNLILAALLSLILRLIIVNSVGLGLLFNILVPVIVLNVLLAVFNFLPIHPLDGGKIFIALLPEKDAPEADLFLHKYGTFILFFLIFPTFNGASPISKIITPVVTFILNILLPNYSLI